MAELSILFLQIFLGISNPTADQINSVTKDQQQQAAPYYYQSAPTTTASGYITGTPIDTDELS